MTLMQTVKPARPLAAYIGGKSKLAKTIIAHIDKIKHASYCEGFVGMGGVFLRRNSRPKAEVINDRSGEVANFFRMLSQHHLPFLDFIKWTLTSREEFNRLVDTRPETLTDLQRAARFLYLQRLAFGGKVSGKNFGVDARGTGRFNTTKLLPLLEEVHKRLAGVIIENLDYKDFIKRYDRKETLFYLDPPYYGNENDYGRGLFSREEFALMAELLKDIQGRFILSLNNRQEVRKIFSDFYQLPVSTTYTVAGADKAKSITELLISNVKLKNK